MSYEVFRKRMLPGIRTHVRKNGSGKEVLVFLERINKSDIIAARITSIKRKKPNGLFYDMEVPVYGNFIANSFILHNSQARYSRIREGLLNDFMKKVGEIASAQFKQQKDLKGVIVGGPGPIKDMFNDGEFLSYDVKKKVLGVIDTSYSGMPGLQELVERSDELLKEASIMHEKRVLEQFFGEFAKDSGLAIYGLHEVIDALKAGSMETLLLSDGFDWIDARFECAKCNFKKDEVLRRQDATGHKCEKCGSPLKLTGENDLAEEIIKLAEDMGTAIENISTETTRGEQLKELGGIAGILRYRQE